MSEQTSRIVTARNLSKALEVHYAIGAKRGDSTGWRSVDKFFSLAPGQLTIITGWPGSGKSEWLDAMLLNATRSGWQTVYYSPENWPEEVHLAKLVEKWAGKPFNPGPTERMSWAEAANIAETLADHVAFIRPANLEALSIGEVFDRALEFFMVNDGKRALVIDPWNEVLHLREPGESETDYISSILGYIRRWARANRVHVFIVAHPAKQRREDGKLPIPTPDMISGSQHWWNKADNCMTVFRNYADDQAPVEVHVQKVRFKNIGRIGVAELRYDKPTGQYWDYQMDAEGREYFYSMAQA